MNTRIPTALQPIQFEPKREVSRDERLRLERVAVGRICGCGNCYCCEELRRTRQTTREE